VIDQRKRNVGHGDVGLRNGCSVSKERVWVGRVTDGAMVKKRSVKPLVATLDGVSRETEVIGSHVVENKTVLVDGLIVMVSGWVGGGGGHV
jgi:hypothetical protein